MSKIKVLKIEPGKLPEEIEIDDDLDTLQKAVSIGAPYQGYIEVVGAERGVVFIMNEEGKLINLPPNRVCANDVFCGVFYVAGTDGQLFTSLPEHKIQKYKKFFGEESIL